MFRVLIKIALFYSAYAYESSAIKSAEIKFPRPLTRKDRNSIPEPTYQYMSCGDTWTNNVTLTLTLTSQLQP